jgi:hypothetical protein
MLNIGNRVSLRKRHKNLTPQMKNSENVNHFFKEGISRRTVCNILNKLQTEHLLQDNKKTGRPFTWTFKKKKKIKEIKYYLQLDQQNMISRQI